MRNNFREKPVVLIIIFLTLIIAFYLVQTNQVSFLPLKKNLNNKLVSDLSYRGKEYSLSYGEYPANSVIEIADFKEPEKWVGDSYFNERVFIKNGSSLGISSRNHESSITSLSKKLNLKDLDTIKFIFYVETDPSEIETFNLVFQNKSSGKTFHYSIRDLRSDWNFLKIPKDQFVNSSTDDSYWQKIDTVTLELTSRPKKMVILDLGLLWAETNQDYFKNWDFNYPNFLSLSKIQNKIYLSLIGYGRKLAVLKEIPLTKDYDFRVKFVPLGRGKFGLFLRSDYKSEFGYFLVLDGVGQNTWQIFKVGVFDNKVQSIVLASGEMAGFQIEQTRPYWLKGELNGPKINFYYSLDGNEYHQLGEVVDTSFTKGNLGVMAEDPFLLVDDLFFLNNN